eukprot:COSAG06_NODE_63057_length_263_cov_0.719512_1_plen_52_part_01
MEYIFRYSPTLSSSLPFFSSPFSSVYISRCSDTTYIKIRGGGGGGGGGRVLF